LGAGSVGDPASGAAAFVGPSLWGGDDVGGLGVVGQADVSGSG
jgi:hypothetical protein